MVNAITGAEKGDAYWMQCQHYYKGLSRPSKFGHCLATLQWQLLLEKIWIASGSRSSR